MSTTPILGCTNPAAANYNPNATQDDGSCYYVNKIAGVCYAFEDVSTSETLDESFTLSFSTVDNNWVFFHDYIPDFYFSTREQLYNFKTGQAYVHNQGAPGIYHGNSTPYPFFIDVIFNANKELTLNAVNFLTKVLNPDGSDAPFDTLTHITIWNSYQCTGRIAMSQITTDYQENLRKVRGRWSFSDFRDMVTTQGVSFLQNIFNNFAVNPSIVGKPAWFDQKLIEDNYFAIRFEFDNTTGKKLYLEDVNIDTTESFR